LIAGPERVLLQMHRRGIMILGARDYE